MGGGEGERFRFRLSGFDDDDEGFGGVGSCTGSRCVDMTNNFV